MTDSKRTQSIKAALNTYRDKMRADPGGARDRLIATGIWEKNGELAPEYGGPPRGTRKAA